jgi:hypothetical protein
VDARFDIDHLVFTAAAAYLARFAYLDLKSGQLNVHGDVHAVTPAEGPPDARFTGDIVVNDRQLFDTTEGAGFLRFQTTRGVEVRGPVEPAALIISYWAECQRFPPTRTDTRVVALLANQRRTQTFRAAAPPGVSIHTQ